MDPIERAGQRAGEPAEIDAGDACGVARKRRLDRAGRAERDPSRGGDEARHRRARVGGVDRGEIEPRHLDVDRAGLAAAPYVALGLHGPAEQSERSLVEADPVGPDPRDSLQIAQRNIVHRDQRAGHLDVAGERIRLPRGGAGRLQIRGDLEGAGVRDDGQFATGIELEILVDPRLGQGRRAAEERGECGDDGQTLGRAVHGRPPSAF